MISVVNNTRVYIRDKKCDSLVVPEDSTKRQKVHLADMMPDVTEGCPESKTTKTSEEETIVRQEEEKQQTDNTSNVSSSISFYYCSRVVREKGTLFNERSSRKRDILIIMIFLHFS